MVLFFLIMFEKVYMWGCNKFCYINNEEKDRQSYSNFDREWIQKQSAYYADDCGRSSSIPGGQFPLYPFQIGGES